MKKIIIIALAVLLVAAIAIIAVIVADKLGENGNNGEETTAEIVEGMESDETGSIETSATADPEKMKGYAVLHADTADELKSAAEQCGAELVTLAENELYMITKLTVADRDIALTVQCDGKGSLTRLDGSFQTHYPNNGVTIQQALDELCNGVAEFFNIADNGYSVYGKEGNYYHTVNEASLVDISEGKANAVITAIDKDGTYWHLKFGTDENGMFKTEFFHVYDAEEYKNGSENIDLSEQGE